MGSETRYVFITGGVVSSLGKGLASAALGALLQAHGYRVRLRKLDPYLNVDPGTMSPYQHGECYVTDDGAETDLDLGHYERFTGVAARRSDSVSAGQIYQQIISKERRGDYLGGTVQVVPHVTDAIKAFIAADSADEDFILCEIGGTVGDIEGLPFLEAIRQFGNEVGRERAAYLHCTLLPWVAAAGELKTKPTQHSVKELLSVGIQPDLLLCRADREIPLSERRKIALFCNMRETAVIPALDVDTIYHVPNAYHAQGLDAEILRHFRLLGKNETRLVDLSNWRAITHRIREPEGAVTIGVIGKYVGLPDAYKSLNEALIHGGIANRVRVHIRWLDAVAFETSDPMTLLQGCHAVLIPGGFGKRGVAGKIVVTRFAREHKLPWFGICLGMQIAVIETARTLAGLANAGSSEFDADADPVVGLLTEWSRDNGREVRRANGDLGGTMRLGAYPCVLAPEGRPAAIYGARLISERHRHRYEVNIAYRAPLEAAGLEIVGLSPEGALPEIIERRDHPWFIGVQFHPELKSRPFDPHPLFRSFIAAAIDQSRLV